MIPHCFQVLPILSWGIKTFLARVVRTQGWNRLTAEMGAPKGPAAEKMLVLMSLTTQTVCDQVRVDASDAQASVRTS